MSFEFNWKYKSDDHAEIAYITGWGIRCTVLNVEDKFSHIYIRDREKRNLFVRTHITSTDEDHHMDIAMDMVENYILKYLHLSHLKDKIVEERNKERELIPA